MMTPYAARRAQLCERLGPRACAVIPGAVETRRNSDVHHRFRQPSDLYYLTGFGEPEAMAVFTPGRDKPFTLFLRPRDLERETWTGRRAGLEGGRDTYGADQSFPIAEAEARLYELLNGYDEVYLHPGDDSELDAMVLRTLAKLRRAERSGGYAPRRLVDIGGILHEMRMLKDDDALARMRRAAAITAEAHRLAMLAARAGRFEYELEALIDYTFRRHDGHPGYGTIVGTGDNATILHYVDCSAQLRPGQMLLVDAGCEWQGFTADVTRSYPVATPGSPARFTPAQRRLYDVVLRAQLAGIACARPGSSIEAIHERCTQVLTEGMVEIGLLSGDPAELIARGEHKRYYLHRTSHWLGMDVHDVGAYFPEGPSKAPRPFAPGMVLTIEPGLYISDTPENPAEYRGIGIRVEDDVLITADGHEVLTSAVPKQPEELEAIVGSGATLVV